LQLLRTILCLVRRSNLLMNLVSRLRIYRVRLLNEISPGFTQRIYVTQSLSSSFVKGRRVDDAVDDASLSELSNVTRRLACCNFARFALYGLVGGGNGVACKLTLEIKYKINKLVVLINY
jgi:hypothetical protein